MIRIGAAKASAKDEPPAQPTDDDKQFAEDALKWHNYYRTKHGVNSLKLSAEVSSEFYLHNDVYDLNTQLKLHFPFQVE